MYAFVRECVRAFGAKCVHVRVCGADLAIYFFDFHHFGSGGGGGGGVGGIGGDRGTISWDVPLFTDSSIFVFIINKRV